MKQILASYKSWVGVLITLSMVSVSIAVALTLDVLEIIRIGAMPWWADIVVIALILGQFGSLAMTIAGGKIKKYIAYRMRDLAIWLIHRSEPVLEAESSLSYVIVGPAVEEQAPKNKRGVLLTFIIGDETPVDHE